MCAIKVILPGGNELYEVPRPSYAAGIPDNIVDDKTTLMQRQSHQERLSTLNSIHKKSHFT